MTVTPDEPLHLVPAFERRDIDSMIVLALDCDGVITKRPEFCRELIALARRHDIKVHVVTASIYDEESKWSIRELLHDPAVEGSISVIFTSGEAKQSYCARHGIKIDWWLDDDPSSILNGK